MAKKRDSKENLDLAEEHIDLAEDIIIEESRKDNVKNKKALDDAAFCLEKAEADLEEAE